MGHIVFAQPAAGRQHLHDRLRLELERRTHRVDALFTTPARHSFYACQGVPCALVAPVSGAGDDGPWPELVEHELRRTRATGGTWWRRRRATALARHFARLAPAVRTWLAATGPDLVLLHQERTAVQRLVQFVARELGIGVLWTGDGLLPHTQQHDPRGLDGDASACGRDPFEVRGAADDPALRHACLVHVLSRSEPIALSRRSILVPPWRRRWRDALVALRDEGAHAAREALRGQAEARDGSSVAPLHFELPGRPFVTLLLQDPDDPRVCLDADRPPAAQLLAITAHGALRAVDAALELVVVAPPSGLRRNEAATIAGLPRTHIVPAAAAPDAAASALATLTINHPLAIVALLAGHPVLHTGRALFGLSGVAHHVPAAAFAGTLGAAVRDDPGTLRDRFLSDLLATTHLWCSATRPDHNGLLGLVQLLEAQLRHQGSPAAQLHYRPGPAWPLRSDGRG
jgi:hypothetical protein